MPLLPNHPQQPMNAFQARQGAIALKEKIHISYNSVEGTQNQVIGGGEGYYPDGGPSADEKMRQSVLNAPRPADKLYNWMLSYVDDFDKADELLNSLKFLEARLKSEGRLETASLR